MKDFTETLTSVLLCSLLQTRTFVCVCVCVCVCVFNSFSYIPNSRAIVFDDVWTLMNAHYIQIHTHSLSLLCLLHPYHFLHKQ